jgi:hypothetical protein
VRSGVWRPVTRRIRGEWVLLSRFSVRTVAGPVGARTTRNANAKSAIERLALDID